MLHIPSYSNIASFGHKILQNIFDYEVTIEEKVDGCFEYNSPVTLSGGGTLPIGKIVNNKLDVEVLSYNIKTGYIEPKKVINWFKYNVSNPNEFMEIVVKGRTTSRKTTLRLTYNHKVYTDNGYKFACDINIGDFLYRPDYKMDYIQSQLIIGSLLGDGSLNRKENGNSRFSCGHVNKEYSDLKSKILFNLGVRNDIRISGYGSTMHRLHTHNLPELSTIYDIMYTGNKKYINSGVLENIGAIAIAFWYMDDGSYSGNQAQFSTNGFNYDENMVLYQLLKNFGIDSVIRKTRTYYQLVVTQDNTDKLFYLIAQYIPKCMQYKIPNKFKYLCTFWDNYNYSPDGMNLLSAEVLEINRYTPVSKVKYDIEVDDNHNYFCHRILVSNSQISFGNIDGELCIRSKGADILIDAPEKMFSKGVDTIKNIFDREYMREGWIYRGEFLGSCHHNALTYNRVPYGNIIIWDIDKSNQDYLPWEEKKYYSQCIGLECVPMIYRGKIESLEQLQSMLERESILGGTKIEGVVFKCYNQYTPDHKILVGKYVRPNFQEVNKSAQREHNPKTGDVITDLIRMYRSENRWRKAIEHLRDSGELLEDPKDIGRLIKEIQNDIVKEEEEPIKDILWKYAKDSVLRGAINGFPEWYKDQLIQKQINRG